MSSLRLMFGVVAFSAAALVAMAAAAQTPDDVAEEDAWVSGNLLFLAYHEAGHLLLDQVYRMDQAANRLAAEQSADDIATWLLSPDPEGEIESSPAIAAIGGWLEAADAKSSDGPWDNPHYPDDATRAARIACMLYGSDLSTPNAFAPLADIIALKYAPASCKALYATIDSNLEGVFGDPEDEDAEPIARVRVVYDEPPPALSDARDFLMEARTLEDLQEDLSLYIRQPIDVVLRGASCGSNSSGFLYSPSQRQITACYEEVDWFLFGDPVDDAESNADAQAAGDELGARPRRHPPLQAAPPPPPRPR